MHPDHPPRPYVGFWNRTAAALIDSALLIVLTLPLQQAVTGTVLGIAEGRTAGLGNILVSYVLPAVVVLVFWKYRSATPGKIFIGAEIVDAATGGKPTNRQLLLRYAGYYVSTVPLLLGLLWVGVDARKQGWHDKLAGTVVVSTGPAEAGKTGAPPRYAPTSPWTYLICVPVLVLILVLLVAAVASLPDLVGPSPDLSVLG